MMNDPRIGWALATIAFVLATLQYGWPGSVLALSVIVFWLLLQFSRSLRAMRSAAQSPAGWVESAVMLHARMRTGLRLLEVLALTRSLGLPVDRADWPATLAQALPPPEEVWRWQDESGAAVVLALRKGRCIGWVLLREEGPGHEAPGPAEQAP